MLVAEGARASKNKQESAGEIAGTRANLHNNSRPKWATIIVYIKENRLNLWYSRKQSVNLHCEILTPHDKNKEKSYYRRN